MKKEKEGPAEVGEAKEEPGEEMPDLNDPVGIPLFPAIHTHTHTLA